jgi:hypothetical protein
MALLDISRRRDWLCRHIMNNPFMMPADEEVFRMREEEKRRKREERELLKSLRVHEKGTFASRMGTTRPPELVAGDDAKVPPRALRLSIPQHPRVGSRRRTLGVCVWHHPELPERESRLLSVCRQTTSALVVRACT